MANTKKRFSDTDKKQLNLMLGQDLAGFLTWTGEAPYKDGTGYRLRSNDGHFFHPSGWQKNHRTGAKGDLIQYYADTRATDFVTAFKDCAGFARMDLEQEGGARMARPIAASLRANQKRLEEEEKANQAARFKEAQRLFNEAEPLIDLPLKSVAWTYFLETRQFPKALYEGGLLSTDVRLGWQYQNPVIVCAVRGLDFDPIARDYPFLGVHLTHLTSKGENVAWGPKRIELGTAGQTRQRAIFPTWKSEPANAAQFGRIGIAEGLEDALRIALQDRTAPCWSLMNASTLGGLEPLPWVDSLEIYEDADPVGQEAADRTACRWIRAGKQAHIITPNGAKDFDESLMAQAA